MLLPYFSSFKSPQLPEDVIGRCFGVETQHFCALPSFFLRIRNCNLNNNHSILHLCKAEEECISLVE